jgi:hypothetical protein
MVVTFCFPLKCLGMCACVYGRARARARVCVCVTYQLSHHELAGEVTVCVCVWRRGCTETKLDGHFTAYVVFRGLRAKTPRVQATLRYVDTLYLSCVQF